MFNVCYIVKRRSQDLVGFYISFIMLKVDLQPLGKSKQEGLHSLREAGGRRSWVGRVTSARVWGGLACQEHM